MNIRFAESSQRKLQGKKLLHFLSENAAHKFSDSSCFAIAAFEPPLLILIKSFLRFTPWRGLVIPRSGTTVRAFFAQANNAGKGSPHFFKYLLN